MQKILFRNKVGDNLTGNLPKGHMNGLMLVVKPEGQATYSELYLDLLQHVKISAKFQSEKTHYLIPNLPLSVFRAISNIEYGSGGDLSRLINSGALGVGGVALTKSAPASADDAESASWNYSIQSDSVVLYIDFGSIYCNNGDEFLFELTNLKSEFKVSAYAISQELEPAGFIKYDIDYDLNEVYKGISKAWVYTETIDKDFTLIIDSDEDNSETDFDGMRAYTQLFGEIENVGSGIVTEVWESVHGIPQDVWLKITNNDDTKPLQPTISSFGIVTRRIEFPEYNLRKQAQINQRDYKAVLKKFELTHPNLARPMQQTGFLPASKDFYKKRG